MKDIQIPDDIWESVQTIFGCVQDANSAAVFLFGISMGVILRDRQQRYSEVDVDEVPAG